VAGTAGKAKVLRLPLKRGACAAILPAATA
jgi:hypothetical protein